MPQVIFNGSPDDYFPWSAGLVQHRVCALQQDRREHIMIGNGCSWGLGGCFAHLGEQDFDGIVKMGGEWLMNIGSQGIVVDGD